MLGRGEEDGLSSRKKRKKSPSFLRGKLPWDGLHARSYHRGISSGNDDKMALKINGCVSSALSLSHSLFLPLSYSCLSFSLFLRLSLIYQLVPLVPDSALSHPTFPLPLAYSFSPSLPSVTHCYGYVARYPSHPHLYSIIYKLLPAQRHGVLVQTLLLGPGNSTTTDFLHVLSVLPMCG